MVKNVLKGWTSNYQRKQNEVKEVVKESQLRYGSILLVKDTDGLGGGEFYGFRGDSGRHKGRSQKEMGIEIERHGGIIYTYSNDTKDRKEAQLKYGN